MDGPSPDPEILDPESRTKLGRMSRRGLAIAAGSALAGVLGLRWANTRSGVDGIPWPFRRALRFNESVWRALPGRGRLAAEFPPSRAREPRANGSIGLDAAVDLDGYRLRVASGSGDRQLGLDELRAMPRSESVNELKCVEGWSEVVRWSGVRLADLAGLTGLASRSGARFDPSRPPGDLYNYVALETPDAEYYVGLDMAAALHPQSLLCDEMNGAPLTADHGAPLRLAIPVKYGIKNIKRIGTIRFTDDRPRDYWAERGYDWYAGL